MLSTHAKLAEARATLAFYEGMQRNNVSAFSPTAGNSALTRQIQQQRDLIARLEKGQAQ